jgi:predicted transglutaminase-like cysteine proteinase
VVSKWSDRAILRAPFFIYSCLFLGACASQHGAAPVMQLGQAAAPPPGYFEFCRKSPQACGETEAAAAAAGQLVARPQQAALRGEIDRRYWAAVLTSLRSHAASPAAWDAAAAAFQTRAEPDVAASPQSPSPAASGAELVADSQLAAAQAPSVVVWTPETRRLVNAINRSVNAAIVATPAVYEPASADIWAAPTLVGDDRYGDCKDYALKKREALIAAGLPASALSLAIVRTPQNELHAILLVSTDHGDLVLDNRSAWITAWNETGYRWEMRQAASDPLLWFSVAPTVGPRVAQANTLAAFNSAIAPASPPPTLVLARNDVAAP